MFLAPTTKETGKRFPNEYDGGRGEMICLYCKDNAVKGVPMLMSNDYPDYPYQAEDIPAAGIGFIVVPIKDYDAESNGLFVIKGVVEGAACNNSLAAGGYVKVATAGTKFVVDSAKTANTLGQNKTATAASGTVTSDVMLIEKEVAIVA